MNKLKLPNVTLLGIDCVNVERLASAMNVSQSGIEFGAVKLLTSLPTGDTRKIEIPHIGSIEDFSRFCIEDLHNYVDTDYVLLVQYDGFVLNSESWNDEFLKYDYIGAPWPVGTWETDAFPEKLKGTWVVGNGGFSLRSKKLLEVGSRLVKENKIIKFQPEDIALCVWYKDLLEKEGVRFAPVNLAHKFSVESKVEVYGKPFGFHGAYRENIDAIIENYPIFPVYIFMSRVRKKRIEQIQKIFKNDAIEGHIIGSNARGNSDDFSDVDIWFTFRDDDFSSVLEKRFDLYKEVGDIVHICEPHQNAPIDGKFSSVLYKTRVGLLMVDYYLCPQSSAFVTNESKKLFGDIELSLGELGLNPQKVTVDTEYRIDFFICFIFNSIKKLVRKNENPLESLFKEYSYLKEKYGIPVKELKNKEHTFDSLLQVSENIKEFANEKQKQAITEIETFAKLVGENTN
jgi:predicted nucleotidyltransferase